MLIIIINIFNKFNDIFLNNVLQDTLFKIFLLYNKIIKNITLME